MSVIRKRRSWVVGTSGTMHNRLGGTDATAHLTNKRWCEDVVGNYNDANYFYSDSFQHVASGVLNGQVTAFPTFVFHNWPYLNQGEDSIYGLAHLGAATIPPNIDDAITQVAANTNPSKPAVSVPVFLAQLKDLPRSLQRAGILKSKGAGSEGVGGTAVDFNFGWDLLYRDLAKMFQFTAQVDQRVKQITAAHGVGGSRGRGVVWQDVSQTVLPSQAVWTVEVSVSAIRTIKTHRKMWASIRWMADSPDTPSATETLQQARRIVHGWRLSPADVWELVPWSWFVDYFANVGDYLEATSNNLGIHSERGCVMTETDTIFTDVCSTSNPGVQTSPAVMRRVTKERVPATPSLTFHSIPFLGPKQLVTLSSIAQSIAHLG